MVTLVMRADIIVKSVFLFVWLVYMAKQQGVSPDKGQLPWGVR